MSDWQVIETAPIGEAVELGWWDSSYDGKLLWKQGPGMVVKHLLSRRKTGHEFGRGYATHWRTLPEPPTKDSEK